MRVTREVLGLQRVSRCDGDKGGGEHDGLGSIEGAAGHDQQGLQCDGDKGGGEHVGLGSIVGGVIIQGLQGVGQCGGGQGGGVISLLGRRVFCLCCVSSASLWSTGWRSLRGVCWGCSGGIG